MVLEQPENSGTVVPRPDPTILTTAQLIREIATVERNSRDRLDGVKEIIETRLIGNDKAIELLQKATDRVPESVKSAVAQLQELHEEKFSSVDRQFAERDTRTEQTSRDNKVAIDAALQAQKEAVAKSEVGFTKQIDNISTLIASQVKASDDKIDGLKTLIASQAKAADEKIDDLKTRVAANDGRKQGVGEFVGYIIGGVGVLVAITTLVFVIIKFSVGTP